MSALDYIIIFSGVFGILMIVWALLQYYFNNIIRCTQNKSNMALFTGSKRDDSRRHASNAKVMGKYDK
jgi:hypothetical protein